MRRAPEPLLHTLFDAAMAVDGCMLCLFEHEHPEAPEAFRSWCEKRGHIVDAFSFVATVRGGYHVLGLYVRDVVQISIHMDADDYMRRAV